MVTSTSENSSPTLHVDLGSPETMTETEPSWSPPTHLTDQLETSLRRRCEDRLNTSIEIFKEAMSKTPPPSVTDAPVCKTPPPSMASNKNVESGLTPEECQNATPAAAPSSVERLSTGSNSSTGTEVQQQIVEGEERLFGLLQAFQKGLWAEFEAGCRDSVALKKAAEHLRAGGDSVNLEGLLSAAQQRGDALRASEDCMNDAVTELRTLRLQREAELSAALAVVDRQEVILQQKASTLQRERGRLDVKHINRTAWR